MLKFVISITVAVFVGFAWMVVWGLALRSFGILVFMHTPQERAVQKQRILQMGRLRYIFLFGVLDGGFGLGLAIAIAIMMQGHSADWGLAAPRACGPNCAVLYLMGVRQRLGGGGALRRC